MIKRALYIGVILASLCCEDLIAQTVPTPTYTPNYKLRKYLQGQNPSADSLNKNWTDADLAIYSGIKVITDKGGQVQNVKAYGAKGDGVADDAAAIRSALAAGYHVLLPEGTYLIKSTLYINADQSIEGAGRGVTTIKASTNTFTVLRQLVGGFNIAIRNLNIDGNNLATNGIWIEDSTGGTTANLILENVGVHNCTSAAIRLKNHAYASLKDLNCSGSKYGLYLESAAISNIVGGSFYNNSEASIFSIKSDYNLYNGCSLYNDVTTPSPRLMLLDASHSNVLAGVRFEPQGSGNVKYCLELRDSLGLTYHHCTDNVIDNCRFLGSAYTTTNVICIGSQGTVYKTTIVNCQIIKPTSTSSILLTSQINTTIQNCVDLAGYDTYTLAPVTVTNSGTNSYSFFEPRGVTLLGGNSSALLATPTLSQTNLGQFSLQASTGLFSVGISGTSPYPVWIQAHQSDAAASLPLWLNPSGGDVLVGSSVADTFRVQGSEIVKGFIKLTYGGLTSWLPGSNRYLQLGHPVSVADTITGLAGNWMIRSNGYARFNGQLLAGASGFSTADPSLLRTNLGIASFQASTVYLSFGVGASSPYPAWIQAHQSDADASEALALNPAGGKVYLGYNAADSTIVNGYLKVFYNAKIVGTLAAGTVTTDNLSNTGTRTAAGAISVTLGGVTSYFPYSDNMIYLRHSAYVTDSIRGESGNWVIKSDGSARFNGVITSASTAAMSISGNAATATNALQWDGGSTSLVASTGRTSLGLGSAALSASSDFAPAAGSSSITSVGTLAQNLSITGSYTSGAPTGGTAGAWKHGIVVTTTGLLPSTTTYIQLDVGGTLYKLAVFQ